LRLEQCADVGFVTFLDGRAVAVPGVVDQNIDTAEPLLGLTDRVGDLEGVSDVKGECEDAVCVAVGEVGDLPDVAGGHDRIVTCGNDGIGQGATQSGRASGDEPGGHLISRLLVVGGSSPANTKRGG
jgi:hypothetical protein